MYMYFYHGCNILTNQIAQKEVDNHQTYKLFINLHGARSWLSSDHGCIHPGLASVVDTGGPESRNKRWHGYSSYSNKHSQSTMVEVGYTPQLQ